MPVKCEVPVTSIIRRHVQTGRESDFKEWTQGIDDACRKFPGFKDLNLIYPDEPGGEYITILSFDTFDNYLTWENSPERAFWLQNVRAMTDGEVNRELIRGFGYWLGSDNYKGKSWPPKFRMIVVAYAAIWPLIYFISPLLAHYLPANRLPASLLSTGVITLLMGYFTLPLAQRIMLPWLKKG